MMTVRERLFWFPIAALLGLSVAGCDSVPLPGESTRSDAKWTALAPSAPRLQPGDKIKVVVYGEDKMSGDYEVDANGSIVVPIVGGVRAAGLTRTELEQTLVQRLRNGQYLRSPIVTVDMAAFRPFYVMGEVEKPGEYPFRSGLTAMSAMAVAGGQTYRASRSYVEIQRAGEQGFTEYPLSGAVAVLPGDIVRVPERYF